VRRDPSLALRMTEKALRMTEKALRMTGTGMYHRKILFFAMILAWDRPPTDRKEET
jgi:hypothetical protein